MEGNNLNKRSRLKRKPKVSLMAPQQSDTAAINSELRDGNSQGGDVIVVREESTSSVTTSELPSEIQAAVPRRRPTNLEILAEVMSQMEEESNQQPPQQSLPDMPPYHYQACPMTSQQSSSPDASSQLRDRNSEEVHVVFINEESGTGFATIESGVTADRDDRARNLGLQALLQAFLEATRSPPFMETVKLKELPTCARKDSPLSLSSLPPNLPALPDICPDNSPSLSSLLSGLPSLPDICPNRLWRKKRTNSINPSQGQRNGHVPQNEALVINQSNQQMSVHQIPQNETSVTSQCNQQTSIHHHTATASNLPAAKTNSSPRELNPEQNKPASKTKHKIPAISSKHEASRSQPMSCKPAIPSSGLFSKFSSTPQMSDDLDEFEETSYQRPTVSTKLNPWRPARGKTLAQKRPSETPDASYVSKKIKTSAGCSSDTKNSPVTKLFAEQTKPLFSASKTNPGEKSQPLISSFSVKAPSNKTSMNKTTAANFLGNTSVTSSQNSQQSKFLNTKLDKNPPSNLAAGQTRDSTSIDVSRLPLSNTVTAPVCKQPQTQKELKGKGTSSRERQNVGGGKEKMWEKETRKTGAAASLDERVKSCPLCQVAFSTTMSQIDVDAHIAACLSVTDDDIVW